MKVEKIRELSPGMEIHEKGFKSLGIQNDKAVVFGSLCRIENTLFIKSKTKAYFPNKFDIVIGRVIFNSQDYYKVDLGSCTGILPSLSFMNATKKYRPDLEKDDLVMCQIERVENGDPLLTCKKESLGKIEECFPVESWKIRLFYFDNFLNESSKKKNFSIALGMNGYVWIDGTAEDKREILQLIEEQYS
jgi:exosome complex component RRP40